MQVRWEDRDQREVPGEPGQGPRPGRVPSPQGGTNSPERHSQRVSSSGTRHRQQGFAAHWLTSSSWGDEDADVFVAQSTSRWRWGRSNSHSRWIYCSPCPLRGTRMVSSADSTTHQVFYLLVTYTSLCLPGLRMCQPARMKARNSRALPPPSGRSPERGHVRSGRQRDEKSAVSCGSSKLLQSAQY